MYAKMIIDRLTRPAAQMRDQHLRGLAFGSVQGNQRWARMHQLEHA